jgi:membrane protease YdiL (CAAX protease family)
MGALAWVVAPAIAGPGGAVSLARALLAGLTVGLVWQFVLVLVLVYRERASLRWLVLREALWLRAPRSPRTGKVGGRVWLALVPATLLFAAAGLLPTFPAVAGHDLGWFLDSHEGQAFMSHNWTWFGVIVVLMVFNTVLGEELLFRGLLLPRMAGVFGRWDWAANGFLFAVYHLHMPWAIPSTLLTDTFALAYVSRRYRSAILGIIVHTSQSILMLVLLLNVVLR